MYTAGTLGHNFFHQKDNWRMYSWDLMPYSSFDWRISHGISHHMWPNSILDYEIIVMEPFIYWFPQYKSLLYKLMWPVIAQILYLFAMLFSVSRSIWCA